MLMLGTMLEMKAADVYLLTAETINGSVGKYEVPSNHQLAQNTLSAGESGEPVAQSATDVEPGYYLVGNFFSQYNKGGEYNPGGDGATIDYKNHVYFKFEQQKDKSYAFSIPACLTAHAQILAVDEYDNKMVYGPGEVFNLHGAKNNTSALPSTNGAVGTICGTTAAKKLVGSATLAEDGNYWNLVTRNDGVTDDDGMYTFSFTLDKDGNPSDWQVKHDANTRVTYFIDNMEGATAQPLYDTRIGGKGPFSDNMETPLYFDGSNSYWAIDYIVNDVSTTGILAQAITATPDIHETVSVHNNSGTHDKLFFLGNGGVDYNSTNEYRDKVWANQKPFTLNLHGIKRIKYNPNQGNNDLSMQDGSYGLSGSIHVISGNAADADVLIKTMSMIGDAVEETYDAVTGKWKYTSTAGDMKYDDNERCFSLTISTVDAKYAKSHFRFVANHDADQNWGETDGNITNNKGFARPTYDNAADADNHSCMPDDANDVQFRKTAREDEEGFGSTTPNKKDILWNRPAGIWTIRFYPELDKDGKDISRYTISETKVIKIPFTRCVGKFIRTYSNNVAMAPVDDNVKVYEAYSYGKPGNAKDPQSPGTIYLRQLKYIPANMGVVLVGKQPAEGTFKDGDKLNYSLREAPADMLVEGDNYTAVWTKDDYAGQEWNNYLKPTVTAIDKLGNADTDGNGKILHRFFGLANFHSTNYYKENKTGDDYIGFFRLTQNGRSGANKAYLSIPANTDVDGGVGAKFGYIDFNGQFLGNETDDPNNKSLAKMAIVFDDEDDGGSTTTVLEVKPNSTDADASFYTLQGVKVSRPVKGVYIHNGKKFIK